MPVIPGLKGRRQEGQEPGLHETLPQEPGGSYPGLGSLLGCTVR